MHLSFTLTLMFTACLCGPFTLLASEQNGNQGWIRSNASACDELPRAALPDAGIGKRDDDKTDHVNRQDSQDKSSRPEVAPPKRPRTKKRQTAAPLKQKPVDFNHPPRDYVTGRLAGWTVLVEKQLIDESPALATAVTARLKSKLNRVANVLPKAALPDLRKVKIFVMYGTQATAGGRDNGLEYFRAVAPKHRDWLDPRMASSIVIFNATNYNRLSDLWALKALVHEFGHAHHLEHWPEDRADIYDTWEHAKKTGLYQVVQDQDRNEHVPNYAAQNHLEYFAELTAIYFAGINYFPYTRAGLKKYDPAGYALVQKIWKTTAEE